MGPPAPDGFGRPLVACWPCAEPDPPEPFPHGAIGPLGRDSGLAQSRLDLARISGAGCTQRRGLRAQHGRQQLGTAGVRFQGDSGTRPPDNPIQAP
eukprot:2307301-Alexandrium_andersonii.AAC.1